MNTPDSFLQMSRNKFWQPAANENPTTNYGGQAGAMAVIFG
jgi:hypothetical protein